MQQLDNDAGFPLSSKVRVGKAVFFQLPCSRCSVRTFNESGTNDNNLSYKAAKFRQSMTLTKLFYKPEDDLLIKLALVVISLWWMLTTLALAVENKGADDRQ